MDNANFQKRCLSCLPLAAIFTIILLLSVKSEAADLSTLLRKTRTNASVPTTLTGILGPETNMVDGVEYIFMGGIGSIRWDDDNDDAVVTFSNSFLGNTLATYERQRGYGADQGYSFFTMSRYTQSDISGKPSLSAGIDSGAGDADESYMMAFRTSTLGTLNTDYFVAQNTTNQLFSFFPTTPVSLASVTFTPDGTSDYLVIGRASIEPLGTDKPIIVDLYDATNSQTLARHVRYSKDTSAGALLDDRQSMFAATLLEAPENASLTIQMRGTAYPGNMARAYTKTLFILRLNQFEKFGCEESTGNFGPISTTQEAIVQTQIALDADDIPGDVVVMGYGTFFSNSLASGVYPALYHDFTALYEVDSGDPDNGPGTINVGKVNVDNSPTLWFDEVTINDTNEHTFSFAYGSNDTNSIWNAGLVCAFTKKKLSVEQLAFVSSAQTATQNQSTSAITIQTQTSGGTPVVVNGNFKINLTTDTEGTGEFSLSSDFSSTVTSVTIASGTSTAAFYYRDDVVGTPTITAAESPSQGWTDATQTQTILSNSSGWFDTSFANRRKLTFNNSASGEDLVNFPVLLKLNSGNFNFLNTQDDGADIRFVDADDTTNLDYEVEQWDEGGTSYVWINVPKIDAGSEEDFIYMYYNNDTVSTRANPSAVWNDEYITVHHMAENPNSTADGYCGGGTSEVCESTSNVFHGEVASGAWNNLVSTTGQIGPAIAFDGSDDYIDIGSAESTYDDYLTGTFSAWINFDTTTQVQRIMSSHLAGTAASFVSFAVDTNGKLVFHANNNSGLVSKETSNTAMSAGTWYHVAVTHPQSGADGPKLYINGSEVTTDTTGSSGSGYEALWFNNVSTAESVMGATTLTSRPYTFDWDGKIDELRVSSAARSADWIEAKYLNQSGSSFLTVGAEVNRITQFSFITLEQSVEQNAVSRVIQIEVQDEDGDAVIADADIIFDLSSSSSGGLFSTTADFSSTVNQVVLSEGSSVIEFYYKDSVAGTATITVSENPSTLGYEDKTQDIVVTAVTSNSFQVDVTSPQIAGQEFSMTVTALDEDGAVATSFNDSVTLSVIYVLPDTGTDELTTETMDSFTNGVATITDQIYPNCGTVQIVATETDNPESTGNSSDIHFAPFDFKVDFDDVDNESTGSDPSEHTVNKAFSLIVTARKTDESICTNYLGPATVNIQYIEPDIDQGGTVTPATLTTADWNNGISENNSQVGNTSASYDKWGVVNFIVTDDTLNTQSGTSQDIKFLPLKFDLALTSPLPNRSFYYVNEPIVLTLSPRDFLNSPVNNYQGTVEFTDPGFGLPDTYSFLDSDQGIQNFSIAGSSEFKDVVIRAGDRQHSNVAGETTPITTKQAKIKVFPTQGPVGNMAVRVAVVDKEENIIMEDNATTFTIEIEEFLDDGSATSETEETPIIMTEGQATVIINNNQAEEITVTAKSTPNLESIPANVIFGTVSGSGIGVQMYRELKKEGYDEY